MPNLRNSYLELSIRDSGKARKRVSACGYRLGETL
jgi:hypothetical protein